MSLFAELRRRNVFKVGAAYVIVGWLVMQVGEVMAPALHLPEWIQSALAFFIILGFPFALFFAWAFEMTPDGLKKEKDVDRDQSITTQTGQKLNVAITALLVLALGYFAIDKFVLDPGRDQAEIDAAVESATQAAPEPATAKDAEPDRSIAVLPFVNMSSDPEQEYFSDGITEELLNLLAKIPELRVAARTSSFSFKGQNIEIPVIAERLGVAHILEGSVRKAGNQLRITAQLIHADDGFHLWSETYDRELDNIFAIQDEISSAVVDALKVTLLGEAPSSHQTDPEAYRLYLEGQYFFNQRSLDSLQKAADLLERSVTIDPGYAPAWAELAFVRLWMAAAGGAAPSEITPLAEEATRRALELDPDLSLAYTTRAIRLIFFNFKFEEGLAAYQKAFSLDPGGAISVAGYGIALNKLGRFEEAGTYLEKGAEMDPLVPEAYANLGRNYEPMRQFALAQKSYENALALSPDFVGMHHRLTRLHLLQGDYESALIQAEQEVDASVYGPASLAKAYHSLGRAEESDRVLNSMIEEAGDVGAFQIAEVFAWRGEVDKAFEWLYRARDARDGGVASLLGDWFLQSLWDDPRWETLLGELGLLNAWQDMPPEWGGPQP